MRDKMKGLLIGLTIGTMMTGSLAYAAGAKQIDVYFRELKFIFDGVEKKTDGQNAFIYDGTTYVPIRFISESLGKEVNFDNDTGTVFIGKNYGGEGAAVEAVYQGGQVTKVELDTYIHANAFYQQRGVPANDAAIRGQMLNQLIALKWFAAKADQATAEQAEQTAQEQLGQIQQYFGSADSLAAGLKSQQLNEYDLKGYIIRNILAQKGIEQTIDDAALQAEFDNQRKADSGAFVTATVRHILIATTDASTGKSLRTDGEALARAKEVKDKLANGGDFTELAKSYSDDPGSKDNGGRFENADISGFVAPFKKAALELPLHQVSDPVQTSYGYHIIEVESRTVKTPAQVKPQLIEQLVGKLFQQFIEKELPEIIIK